MCHTEVVGRPVRAGYLAPAAVTREHRHRAAAIAGVVGVLLFATGPLLGHPLSGSLASLLAGWDHVGRVCLIALHLLLEPVHAGFHLLIGAGLLYAAYDRARVWWRVRRTLAPLEAVAPEAGGPFTRAAARAGLDPRRVRVVPGLPNPAFTVGWWRPVVYVAAGLAHHLRPAELTAVLAHEAAHVRRRDPLRLSLLRFVACALFWVPALRRLAADIGDEAEIQADDAAAGMAPLVLASALVRVAAWGGTGGRLPAHAAPGVVQGDLLDRRVRRLLGEDAPPATHVTRGSIAGAVAALALVWTSSLAVVHPLPHHDPGAVVHCTHHDASPLSHLFCRHGHDREASCPHGTE